MPRTGCEIVEILSTPYPTVNPSNFNEDWYDDYDSDVNYVGRIAPVALIFLMFGSIILCWCCKILNRRGSNQLPENSSNQTRSRVREPQINIIVQT